MSLRPLLRFLVQSIDIGLELRLVDSPHAAAPDFDGRQFPRAHERVDLRDADAQVGGDVLERKETWLDGRLVPATSRAGFRAHAGKIAPSSGEHLDLSLFALV